MMQQEYLWSNNARRKRSAAAAATIVPSIIVRVCCHCSSRIGWINGVGRAAGVELFVLFVSRQTSTVKFYGMPCSRQIPSTPNKASIQLFLRMMVLRTRMIGSFDSGHYQREVLFRASAWTFLQFSRLRHPVVNAGTKYPPRIMISCPPGLTCWHSHETGCNPCHLVV